jgi:alginate O-acetyltransferase complex protein AlgI
MDFSSPLFLFLFLPVVLALYWAIRPRARNLFLLFASLFFYAWIEGPFVFVLLIALAANYLFSILIDRCQQSSTRLLSLATTITTNLALLCVFKYLKPIAEHLNPVLHHLGIGSITVKTLHFPLGISFFTFQAIAYAIDIYRQEYEPQRNPVKFSLFMALFPKISAGPIIRYPEVEQALARPLVSLDDGAYGARRFIIGLGKKLIIADTLAKTADQIFAIPATDLTSGLAWLGIVCYTLQIYFDFSGYTDMAIGLGRMFGFRFRENFDYPYIARSLTEFWRRWHISLSTWFKDYLFIPLSYALMTQSVRKKIIEGRYKTNYRSLFSIFVVFTLCGWWHGASFNFIIWGMLHGLVLALESWKLSKLLKKAWQPLSHAYLLLVIMLGWVFFRSATLSGALAYLQAMAGFGSGTGLNYHPALYFNPELLAALTISIIGSMPIAGWSLAWLDRQTGSPAAGAATRAAASYALQTVFVTAVLLLSLLSVAGSTYKPFIYNRF